MADRKRRAPVEPVDPESFMTLAEVRALVHLSPNKLHDFTTRSIAEAKGLPWLRLVKLGGGQRVARSVYEAWAAELKRREP